MSAALASYLFTAEFGEPRDGDVGRERESQRRNAELFALDSRNNVDRSLWSLELDGVVIPGYNQGMKTAVSIPDPLFAAADKLAHKLGVSRSALYAKALKDFLDKRASRNITAQLNAVYGGESPSSDRTLLKRATRRLERDEW